jgi:uncharacterized delta-60 repeat protein
MRISRFLPSWKAKRRGALPFRCSQVRRPRLMLELLEDRNLLSGTVGLVAPSPIFQSLGLFPSQQVIEPNGDILEVGITNVPGTPYAQFAIARFHADGSLDTSFGNNGLTETHVSNTADEAECAIVQPDGKILVGGSVGNGANIALVRYNADGSLDSSFGTGGILITSVITPNPGPQSVALQADGKILVAGEIDTVQVTLPAPGGSYQSTVTRSGVVRYNADGSLDQSFGTGGELIFSFGNPGAMANAVAVQPDGKFVVVGTSSETRQVVGMVGTSINGSPFTFVPTAPYAETDSFFTVARYNQDGSLDATFAQGGVSQLLLRDVPYSSGGHADGVTVEANGKIVVTGAVDPVLFFHADIYWVGMPPYTDPPQPPNTGPVTVQYNPDGTLDTSFGVGGILFGPLAPPPPLPVTLTLPSQKTPPANPSSPPAAPPTSITPPASTSSTPPTFIAYVTAPASATDATTGPGATPANLTALYLEALSVSGGAPIGGLPLPGGGFGVIVLAGPNQVGPLPTPKAPGDPFLTQISGGGSVIIVDDSADLFAPLTTGDYVPNAAFDAAGEPTASLNEIPLAPSAVMDVMFARLPFAEEGFQRSEPRFDLAEKADRASPLSQVVTTAAAVVEAPHSLKLLESMSFGLVGIGLVGAGTVPRRKKEKLLAGH